MEPRKAMGGGMQTTEETIRVILVQVLGQEVVDAVQDLPTLVNMLARRLEELQTEYVKCVATLNNTQACLRNVRKDKAAARDNQMRKLLAKVERLRAVAEAAAHVRLQHCAATGRGGGWDQLDAALAALADGEKREHCDCPARTSSECVCKREAMSDREQSREEKP
jgi:hypothetical protein